MLRVNRNAESEGSWQGLSSGRSDTSDPCPTAPTDGRLDKIWSNPPIRIGKQALHEPLAQGLPRLVPGGEAWLVVQRHLGADPLARWIAEQTDDAGAPWGEIETIRSARASGRCG